MVNGWMPKWPGAFVSPALSLVIGVCLIVFESIRIQEDAGGLDPRHYPMVVAGVAGLIFVVNLWVLLAGLAVLASVAAARSGGLLAHGASHLQALAGGYQAAFAIGAAFALVAVLFGTVWLRRVEPATSSASA